MKWWTLLALAAVVFTHTSANAESDELTTDDAVGIAEDAIAGFYEGFDLLTPSEKMRVIGVLQDELTTEEFERIREDYFGMSAAQMDAEMDEDDTPGVSGSPSDWPHSMGDFKFPFPGVHDNFWSGEIWKNTCGYGCGRHKNTWHPYAAWNSVDLVRDDGGATRGGAVLATARGIVKYAGWRSGYGWCVEMDHRDGFWSIVGHLQCNPTQFVSLENDLLQGTLIGVTGSSGGNYAPHIHFSVWRYWKTYPLDGISGGATIVANGRYCSGNAHLAAPTGRTNCP